MWLWLREKWAWWAGALGALVLVGYGVVPTLQPTNFGRVYAAYGGVFVAMSMLWGWWVDGQPRPEQVQPDQFADARDRLLVLLAGRAEKLDYKMRPCGRETRAGAHLSA
jgi:drug/metabolite transporter superfamily protein YnfA